MKTNKQNKTNKKAQTTETPGLQNRTEQLSETETANASAKTPEKQTEAQTAPAPEKVDTVKQGAGVRPFVDFAQRDFNRNLPVEKVLEKLQRWMPAQYELAKVVGKWIWIEFAEPPVERVRQELSQLGFHWNNVRKCWQHPCGNALPRGSQEPQQKYEVWFPMDAERRRKQKEAAATVPAAA